MIHATIPRPAGPEAFGTCGRILSIVRMIALAFVCLLVATAGSRGEARLLAGEHGISVEHPDPQTAARQGHFVGRKHADPVRSVQDDIGDDGWGDAGFILSAWTFGFGGLPTETTAAWVGSNLRAAASPSGRSPRAPSAGSVAAG